MVLPFLKNAEFFRGVTYGEQKGRRPLPGVSVAHCTNLNQAHLHCHLLFWVGFPSRSPT